MGVTKTDFMRGMQCPKMLWLDAHKREERIIPLEVQGYNLQLIKIVRISIAFLNLHQYLYKFQQRQTIRRQDILY